MNRSENCSEVMWEKHWKILVSQFNRIWNHLVRYWTEIGWFARSGTVGCNCFCSWKCFPCFRWFREIRECLTTKSMWWKTLMLFLQMSNAHVKKFSQIMIKGRSPTLRHVSRTDWVAPHWLFDQIKLVKLIFLTPKTNKLTHFDQRNFHMWCVESSLCLSNISHCSYAQCSEVMLKRTDPRSTSTFCEVLDEGTKSEEAERSGSRIGEVSPDISGNPSTACSGAARSHAGGGDFGQPFLALSWPHFSRPSSEVERSPVVQRSERSDLHKNDLSPSRSARRSRTSKRQGRD